MPIISTSTYRPPLLFSNGHIQTLYSTLCRKITDVAYVRERIETPDSDFIDLDWSETGGGNYAVLVHGMEGHSRRKYMLGMAQAFNRRGWSTVSMNLRGCSGEPNRYPRSYHSGKTDDLDLAIQHVHATKPCERIVLIGFSIGGNIVLKYLGEQGKKIPSYIIGAAAISVPCDLESCARHMARRSNGLYMKRFLKFFHEKIREKMERMPGQIDDKGFKYITTFKQYDDRYTAPHNGFTNAEDYWRKASCKRYLKNISVPTLCLSAKNDPMLPDQCYPIIEARLSKYLFLEMPESGGHVGFVGFNPEREYWHETRVTDFICGA
ncbi:MAG: alpha/beta fold hydrolase [Chitinivibrionales bacterium]|nr:alpha/beta fold hydrolase [Chitinivibrionales bacterium]